MRGMNHTNPLQELDYRHLWHPYADQTTYESQPHVCIERGEGAYLFDSSGRRLLDGIASWWSVAFGHGHPKLIRAIQLQAEILQQCVLGSVAHRPAVELAARLAALAPGDLNRVYFASDGSSVTEAALKVAVQHWQYQGRPEKTRFIGIEDGYHGDSLGAMSVGFISWFHGPYGRIVPPALIAPTPACACCAEPMAPGGCAAKALDAMAQLLAEHAHETAAIMLEPLCQAAAGMRFYPAAYLTELRRLCDAHEALLIADEIAVGFGRTGTMFACDQAGIVPDMLCLGKALTGGYLPMSALVVRDTIFDSFRGDGIEKRVFWDGHTHCGNPITSALALAALDLIAELDIPQSLAPRIAQLAAGFEHIATQDTVAYARTLGLIGVCAIREEAGGAVTAKRIAGEAMTRGLFIRPLGEVLYLWPPLTVTEQELGDMLHILHDAMGN